MTQMVVASNRNPRLNSTINPMLNSAINPMLNPTINPLLNSAINPLLNPAINPMLNSEINPVLNAVINPLFNSTINPLYNSAINPIYNANINPLMSSSINGLYVFSWPALNLCNFAVSASPQVMVVYDSMRNFTGIVVRADKDVSVQFDKLNAVCGYWIKRSDGLFNVHDKKMQMIAITS